jgi:hypothetical protein
MIALSSLALIIPGITTPNVKNRMPSSKIPRGQSPTELAGVSANEVEVKGYQITSCRKKGALMKFYDVAWTQGVYGVTSLRRVARTPGLIGMDGAKTEVDRVLKGQIVG